MNTESSQRTDDVISPAWVNMPESQVNASLISLYHSEIIYGHCPAIGRLQALMGPALLGTVPIGETLDSLKSLFLSLASDTRVDPNASGSHQHKMANDVEHLDAVMKTLGVGYRTADADGFELAHYLAQSISVDAGGSDEGAEALVEMLFVPDFEASFWSRANQSGRNGLVLYLLSLDGSCDSGHLLEALQPTFGLEEGGGSRPWYDWAVNDHMAGTDVPDAMGFTLFESAAATVHDDFVSDAMESDCFCPTHHRVAHILDLCSAQPYRECCPVPYFLGYGLDIEGPDRNGRHVGDILVDMIHGFYSVKAPASNMTYAVENLTWILAHRPHLAPALTRAKDSGLAFNALASRVADLNAEHEAKLRLYDACAHLSSDLHYRDIEAGAKACAADVVAPSPGPLL